MKKFLIFIVLIFCLSCRKEQADFKNFEISFTNGSTKSYSFRISNDRLFEFYENFGERKGGTLNTKEFENLKLKFLNLEARNLKSRVEDCFKCSIISIDIQQNNKVIKVVQKGKIDAELIEIENTIEKIIKTKAIYPLKPVHYYKTEKDIALPPPSPFELK